MLVEIIVYIALFVTLFSGAFSVTFQTMDAMQYLNNHKNLLDEQNFIASKLDVLIGENKDWSSITDTDLLAELFVGDNIKINKLNSSIYDSSTSTTRFLNVLVTLNDEDFLFSYVQEK